MAKEDIYVDEMQKSTIANLGKVSPQERLSDEQLAERMSELGENVEKLQKVYFVAADKAWLHQEGHFSVRGLVLGTLAAGGLYAGLMGAGIVTGEPLWYAAGIGYLLTTAFVGEKVLAKVHTGLADKYSARAKSALDELWASERELGALAKVSLERMETVDRKEYMENIR